MQVEDTTGSIYIRVLRQGYYSNWSGYSLSFSSKGKIRLWRYNGGMEEVLACHPGAYHPGLSWRGEGVVARMDRWSMPV